MLNDLAHYWGQDLQTSNQGDLQTVNGTLRGQQRVLRRLMTNQGDYLFQPNYGAGLPAWVGQPIDIGKVTALIRSQLMLEPSVSQVPPPVITVTQNPNDLTGFAVHIQYNDADTSSATVLSFNVSQ